MSRFLQPGLRGFQAYAPGRQPADGEAWVKLNTNEAPLPPSELVLTALRDAVDGSLRLYPSPTAAPAREAIAAVLGLTPEHVAVGNGGDELIAMCFRAFVGAGDRVAFPTPTYSLLEPLCGIHQAVPSPHPLSEEWSLPRAFAEDSAPLKFVVNPNSPTSTWLARAAIAEVLGLSEGVVALDEAYVDFAPESRLDLVREGHDNLVILRTFSKAYALAGMRIGYAVGHPELIQALDLVKDSYNVDRLAIVAAQTAIADQEHHARLVGAVVEERDWLSARLRERGFEIAPSATNFLFGRPPPGHPAGEVFEGLLEHKVLVRHYDLEPISGWLRITIGTRDQHEKLLKALREILQ